MFKSDVLNICLFVLFWMWIFSGWWCVSIDTMQHYCIETNVFLYILSFSWYQMHWLFNEYIHLQLIYLHILFSLKLYEGLYLSWLIFVDIFFGKFEYRYSCLFSASLTWHMFAFYSFNLVSVCLCYIVLIGKFKSWHCLIFNHRKNLCLLIG